MARMRTMKPGFFTSEDIAKYPFRARLLFAGLWTYCDDHGRGKDNVRLIKADVWPLDDDVTIEEIEADLQLLHAGGAIVRYRVGGLAYIAVQNWHFHQNPNRPGDTKLPPPPVPIAVPAPGERGHCRPCWTLHEQLSEPSLIPHEQLIAGGEGEKEGEKEGRGSAARPAPPPGSRPRCTRHAHLPDDDPGPNCVGCRDARLERERGRNPPTEIPPWCGDCNEGPRQIELDDGRLARCPRCHPLRSVS